MNAAVNAFFLIFKLLSLYFLAVSLFCLCGQKKPAASAGQRPLLKAILKAPWRFERDAPRQPFRRRVGADAAILLHRPGPGAENGGARWPGRGSGRPGPGDARRGRCWHGGCSIGISSPLAINGDRDVLPT